MYKNKNQKGQVLIEVVIAIGIISTTLVSIWNLLQKSWKISVISRETTLAATVLVNSLEEIRKIREEEKEILQGNGSYRLIFDPYEGSNLEIDQVGVEITDPFYTLCLNPENNQWENNPSQSYPQCLQHRIYIDSWNGKNDLKKIQTVVRYNIPGSSETLEYNTLLNLR